MWMLFMQYAMQSMLGDLACLIGPAHRSFLMCLIGQVMIGGMRSTLQKFARSLAGNQHSHSKKQLILRCSGI